LTFFAALFSRAQAEERKGRGTGVRENVRVMARQSHPLLQLRTERLSLRLRHTFTIARSSEDVAETVVLHVEGGGIDALGESAPIERYAETCALVEARLREVSLRDVDPLHLDAAIQRIGSGGRGAMCALDLALHDRAGKALGVPVYELFGLDPRRAATTSFTIGIADIETMLAKTREAAALPILKVKVGRGGEVELLEAMRGIYRGAMRIDANEAWTPEQAAAKLGELARFDIELCEQPVPAGDNAALRYVRERSPIPIFADESCMVAADVPALAGCVDGIVIKLVKCGGLREAVRMVHVARAVGLKVMLGCMIESSILATAGAHLSPLVDYADLDGPLLITNDPYEGVRFDGARLVLPDAPGLGVRVRAAA
jgi:L-Ala-D/L-Glu epimerase